MRAYAEGLYLCEAAVWLLIGHRIWLGRDDFVAEFIETGASLVDGTAMAFVNWSVAVDALAGGRLACSASEGQVLRIAASLAEGIPVDLGEALSGLDEANLALVVEAVVRAGGRRRAVFAAAAAVWGQV